MTSLFYIIAAVIVAAILSCISDFFCYFWDI